MARAYLEELTLTPPTRGWTAILEVAVGVDLVDPAHAGMDRVGAQGVSFRAG